MQDPYNTDPTVQTWVQEPRNKDPSQHWPRWCRSYKQGYLPGKIYSRSWTGDLIYLYLSDVRNYCCWPTYVAGGGGDAVATPSQLWVEGWSPRCARDTQGQYKHNRDNRLNSEAYCFDWSILLRLKSIASTRDEGTNLSTSIVGHNRLVWSVSIDTIDIVSDNRFEHLAAR